MKASEVYLKAAKLVAKENQFSCCTISAVSGFAWQGGDILREQYSALFAPSHGYAWLEFEFDDGSQEQHDWRVLALLFMHEIAKDEENA